MNPEPLPRQKIDFLLKADRERLKLFLKKKFGFIPCLLITNPSYLCVFLHRVSRDYWCQGKNRRARISRRLNILLTGADIQVRCHIEEGLLIPVPSGVNLSGKMGPNLTVLPVSGTGIKFKNQDIGGGAGLPVLGSNVTLHQFSAVLGPVHIGSGAQLLPGVTATADIPEKYFARVLTDFDKPDSPPIQKKTTRPASCSHKQWKETRSQLNDDIDRYLDVIFRSEKYKMNFKLLIRSVGTNHFLSITLYRISHFLDCNGWEWLGGVLSWLNCLMTKASLSPNSCIGGGLFMPHPTGMIFQGNAGEGLTLYANSLCASLKSPDSTDNRGHPILGNNVTISGQSGVFGAFTLSDETHLAAKVQLTQNTESHNLVLLRPKTLCHVSKEKPEFNKSKQGESDQKQNISEHKQSEEHRNKETLCQLLGKDLRQLKKQARLENPERSWCWFLFPSFLCVFLFRFSHHCSNGGWRRIAYCLWALNYYLTGSDLTPSCKIGGGLVVPYPAGVSISCSAGENLTVMGLSGIGPLFEDGNLEKYWDETPVLGDDVFLGHHCGIYGPVTLGNRVHLDPGCIVMEDVTDGSYCAGVAPTIKSRTISH